MSEDLGPGPCRHCKTLEAKLSQEQESHRKTAKQFVDMKAYADALEALQEGVLAQRDNAEYVLGRLRKACEGLLAFIREKYPEDFKSGGRGYICPHHRAIAEILAAAQPEEKP